MITLDGPGPCRYRPTPFPGQEPGIADKEVAMRHGLILALGILAGPVTGCAPEQSLPTTAWLQQLGFQTPVGPDVVQIEMVLLERPLNDRYINDELWQAADAQVVPLE